MSSIHLRDLEFVLYELLNVASLTKRERFAEHDRETFDSILATAKRIAEEKFAPHAKELDQNPPTFDGEHVHIIPQVKEALKAFGDAGFFAASLDFDLDGMQLPFTLLQACIAMMYATNISTSSYAMLSIGVINMLARSGTKEQQDRFLTPMLEGRCFGTMCLSEPHAGSSLADLRTQATPRPDGDYSIVGNKMWITAGEHELSENIVHLVLARIPGGPPGAKGISLFIVPKYRVDQDGKLGAKNDVQLAGLNHKMGYKGTINTVLNFGEEGDCIGHLLGAPHQGLRYMFNMMNEARVSVGLGATMLGYAGYLYSLDYARERVQGRHPDEKDPSTPPVPIIEHADIKRMLLTQKAYVEGALSLCLYSAWLIDDAETNTKLATKAESALLLDLLTPIVKSWPSTFCLEANNLAIQVLGGAGYTEDHPVERHYRDNRLNPIHEGTHGIQGMDLLGRKVMMKKGAALKLLLQKLQATSEEAKLLPELKADAAKLERAIATVSTTTRTLAAAALQGKTRLFLANASLYLDMLGHVVIAWMWLRQAIVAQHALSNEAPQKDQAFYKGKLRTCHFFFTWELPKIEHQATLLSSLDDSCLSMPNECF